MLKRYLADLHIHTALSPCGDEAMTPDRICVAARAKELDLLAVTDHNTAENAPAMLAAAQRHGVTVLPGMEVQTKEEVHLVCLFPGLPEIFDWQELIYQSLPAANNRPDFFGRQIVFDLDGRVSGENDRLLLTSTALTIEEAVAGTVSRGGICYPAHVDRPSFSIISNLGFIPPELNFPAVELSPLLEAAEALQRFPDLKRYPFVGSSDAHCPEAINWARTEFWLAEPTLAEISFAFRAEQGRRVVTI